MTGWRGWWRRIRWRRAIDAAILGRLPGRRWPALREHLRSDEAARARYDRGIEAIRVLEDRPVAEHEIDLVEGWLLDPVPVRSTRRAWRAASLAALATAAGIALVIGLRPKPIEDDELHPKGTGREAGLGLEVLCGPDPDDPRGLVAAAEEGCDLGDALAFAYAVEPGSGGVLTLFGVDASGRVLYYAPTPVDDRPRLVRPGPRRALPLSIRLDVNHRPGPVRVFALLSPAPVTVADVDEAAAILAGQAPAKVGDPSWVQRLGGRGRIATMCTPPGSCRAAESAFVIREDAP